MLTETVPIKTLAVCFVCSRQATRFAVIKNGSRAGVCDLCGVHLEAAGIITFDENNGGDHGNNGDLDLSEM